MARAGPRGAEANARLLSQSILDDKSTNASMTLPSESTQVSPIAGTSRGRWMGDAAALRNEPADTVKLLRRIDRPVFVVERDGSVAFSDSGPATMGENGRNGEDGLALLAYAPACLPEDLGDRSFRADHGLRYAYVSGAMANGIASERLVAEISRAGMLGFFGAAGLGVDRVRQAVERLQADLGDAPFGINLIHSPNESHAEEALVDLFIERGVTLVEASAFLQLTPAVVRFRLHGIHRDDAGNVIAPNHVIAKVSREEIAEKFMSPAPEKLLAKLLESGAITQEQAVLAAEVPVAQDITGEADSGGHTDHRPAISLLPTLCSLRDRMQAKFEYAAPLRVGLGGGIATPESVYAAFAMGAAYVLTGSINQACVESGSSDTVRAMLAEARQADVARAAAADMFEMGVTVQVLKRGTMFAMRAMKLYELYRAHGSLDEIPAAEREKLEKTVFRAGFDEVWRQTEAFFREHDPRQIERAEKNPKHKMALVFRWYLGQSSNWANSGDPDRVMDYQVWCGPAMGAFNEWTHGSFLERAEDRRVADVARNLLYGAAVLHRVNTLRAQGVALASESARVRPRPAEELRTYFDAREVEEMV
jgi:PfaD family protein